MTLITLLLLLVYKNFVEEHNLWPNNKPFNWRRIFGTHNLLDLTYNTARVWTGQRILSPSIKQEPSSFDIPFIQKADQSNFNN